MTSLAMRQQALPGFPLLAHAELSQDLVYRYTLDRSLDGCTYSDEYTADGVPRRTLLFILLNPSKADAIETDPTIDKLMKYGRREGAHRLSVVNLFAYRETNSRLLTGLHALGTDLIGPENNRYILERVSNADMTVCGWGNEGLLGGRQEQVLKILATAELLCFKRNRNGTPIHPLYQRDDAEWVPFA